MIAVIQSNGNRSKAKGLSGLRAGKNNVLHVSASELLGTLFSKNPADRITYVAFPTAVWANDSRNSIMKFEIDFLCKGLKPVHFNIF